MADTFETLKVDISDRVAKVTIDSPPINLMDQSLYVDLLKLSAVLAEDRDVSVVVLRSANPEFFIAHFDVGLILDFPIDEAPKRAQTTSPRSWMPWLPAWRRFRPLRCGSPRHP